MNKENKILLEVTRNFSGKKIIVWGDYILDEYIYGYTRRISREAPVLILSYKTSQFLLGGAGNSLLNLKKLGADPIPVGVLGQNASGKQVINIIKSYGISTQYLMSLKNYHTPSKTRILAGEEHTRKQQILRIDKESKVPDTIKVNTFITNALKNLINKCDALLISDYNYHTVKKSIYNDLIPHFKKSEIPVALDSRFRLLDFKSATILTPNENEARKALGIDIYDVIRSPKKLGNQILEKTNSDAILLTRGSNGMTLFQKNKKSYNINIYGNDEIVDVTGAGDTVISALTLAMSVGAGLKEAAKIANFAAGIVVMKKGTATVSLEELEEAIVSAN